MSCSSENNSASIVQPEVKSEKLKKRYLLCKNKRVRKKRKMDSDEVATDYKLQQFLNDVEKFSERRKIKQEEQISKSPTTNTKMGKRGLFENGLISRPSVKGILGKKNVARLCGNLENLLKEGNTSNVVRHETDSSMDDVNVINDRKSKDEKKGDTDEEDDEMHFWCTQMDKGLSEINEVNCFGESSKAKNRPPVTEDTKRKEPRDSSKNEVPLKSKKNKNDILIDCSNQFMGIIQRQFLRKALQDEDVLTNNLRDVFEEYIEARKPKMVDKCEQTNEADFSEAVERNGEPAIAIERNDLDSKINNFFDPILNRDQKPEDAFSFNPRQHTSDCILDQVINTPVFQKKTNQIETPQGFKAHFWPPANTTKKKPYIPAILSPPSPGRNYNVFSNLSNEEENHDMHLKCELGVGTPNIEPCFFQPVGRNIFDRPSSSRIGAPALLDLHSSFSYDNSRMLHLPTSVDDISQEDTCGFHSNPPISPKKKHSFSLVGNKEFMQIPSSSNDFSFPKKPKLIFSPHRL